MFESLLWTSTISAIQKTPKEIVYAAAAYFTITEVHKNHAKMKISEAEARAKVHVAELEVEKLRLQLELRDARINNPSS